MNNPELKVSIPIHDDLGKRAQILVEEDNNGKNFKLEKSDDERFQYHLYPPLSKLPDFKKRIEEPKPLTGKQNRIGDFTIEFNLAVSSLYEKYDPRKPYDFSKFVKDPQLFFPKELTVSDPIKYLNELVAKSKAEFDERKNGRSKRSSETVLRDQLKDTSVTSKTNVISDDVEIDWEKLEAQESKEGGISLKNKEGVIITEPEAKERTEVEEVIEEDSNGDDYMEGERFDDDEEMVDMEDKGDDHDPIF